mgnify:CR=1 FL=1
MKTPTDLGRYTPEELRKMRRDAVDIGRVTEDPVLMIDLVHAIRLIDYLLAHNDGRGDG